MSSGFGVFLGLDVGKGTHHAVGLDPAGKRLRDGPLPDSEPKLRALFDKLAAHGELLVVVDQPATIGALPVAVARAAGHRVAYLSGLAMRHRRPLPGPREDRRAGRVRHRRRGPLAAAHAAPGRRRRRRLGRAGCTGRVRRRLGGRGDQAVQPHPGLLTGVHPALERAIGPRISHPAVLEILSRCGGPVGIARAGRRRLTAIATAPGMGDKLVTAILTALEEQTVIRRSGSSIKGEHPARTGNRKLQRAFFLAASAALIRLARRRCDVLFAMLRTKTFHRAPETTAAA